MQAWGVSHLAGRPVGELSGGELARLHLARVFATGAPTLLLDEPAAALDIEHQIHLMEQLAARATAGNSVVAALHDLDLAERYCSRLVVLSEGEVVADGTPGEALTGETLARVFRVRRGSSGRLERIGSESILSH